MTNTIGWIGSLALVAAYFSLSFNWIKSGSWSYQLLNIFGSVFLAWYTAEAGAYASTLVNIIWMLIGLASLKAILATHQPKTMQVNMQISKINLKEKFELFEDLWNPKIIGRLNQQLVKVAKFKGAFTSHKHDDEDELFLVIQGKLSIELETETIELNPGELVIIPRGVTHKPYAEKITHVLLFEPAATLNTGHVQNDLTADELQEI